MYRVEGLCADTGTTGRWKTNKQGRNFISQLTKNQKLASGLPKLPCLLAPECHPNCSKNAPHCRLVIRKSGAGATQQLSAISHFSPTASAATAVYMHYWYIMEYCSKIIVMMLLYMYIIQRETTDRENTRSAAAEVHVMVNAMRAPTYAP